MKVIETIQIEPLSLENQKPTDITEFYFEIRDNSILVSCRFYADEPKNADDKALGWHNVFTCFRTVAAKQNIAGLEKTFMSDSGKWGIFIMISGFANDIKVFFKKESQAQELFDKLQKWLYE